MNNISNLKIAVSWIVSTALLLSVSAILHSVLLVDPTLDLAATVSPGLIIPLATALFAAVNLVVHSIFYFGGFSCSPIRKGVGISMCIGFVYLMVVLLCSNIITVHASWTVIGMNLLTTIMEMLILGLLVSVISISEIHRWGVFRWV